MEPPFTYTMEFKNLDKEEMLYAMAKAAHGPLDMELLRWKMGMTTAKRVMAKYKLSQTDLDAFLANYKERAGKYLYTYRLFSSTDTAEFKAQVEAVNQWLAQQEPDPES